MNKIALIIGRFQPMHKGHLELVKRYSKAKFFIKIGIGSSQKCFERNNPLTYEEREKIVRLIMKENNIKRYKIFKIPDIADDKLYVRHVMKIVGRFDTIITGNPKVLKLFKNFKSKKPWNIESFEEKTRPGGQITATQIRNIWIKRPSKKGIYNSTYSYLKAINFSKRLMN